MPAAGARILVMGSSGFIGRALFRYLEENGMRVFGADMRIINDVENASFIDLLEISSVRSLLEKIKPDIIFHAAGIIEEGELEFETAHLETTRVLLECVLTVRPESRIVIVGSAAEYGRPSGDKPIREGSREDPESNYGRSKLAQSDMARRYALEWDLDVVRVRVFNTLGPGQDNHLVAGAIVERLWKAVCEKSRSIDVFDPESRRDFLDVRDVARLMSLTALRLERNPGGPAVHIASGKGTSVLELAQTSLAVAGLSGEIKLNLIPGPESSSIVGETPTLLGILEEDPLMRISLRGSLRDMWNWRRAQS